VDLGTDLRHPPQGHDMHFYAGRRRRAGKRHLPPLYTIRASHPACSNAHHAPSCASIFRAFASRLRAGRRATFQALVAPLCCAGKDWRAENTTHPSQDASTTTLPPHPAPRASLPSPVYSRAPVPSHTQISTVCLAGRRQGPDCDSLYGSRKTWREDTLPLYHAYHMPVPLPACALPCPGAPLPHLPHRPASIAGQHSCIATASLSSLPSCGQTSPRLTSNTLSSLGPRLPAVCARDWEKRDSLQHTLSAKLCGDILPACVRYYRATYLAHFCTVAVRAAHLSCWHHIRFATNRVPSTWRARYKFYLPSTPLRADVIHRAITRGTRYTVPRCARVPLRRATWIASRHLSPYAAHLAWAASSSDGSAKRLQRHAVTAPSKSPL